MSYDPYHRPRFSLDALAALARIGARAWLIIGAVVLVVLGLVTWAGIAVLSWLWGQLPGAAEAGRRLAGEAATQIEQTAPGLTQGFKEQIDQVAPGLTQGLKEQIDQVAPGLKETVGQLAPGRGAETPSSDVSGADIGPVPRFPGLVRSHFSRRDGAVEVRYAGAAAFEVVRAHYVAGFTSAGYTQEVLEATPDAEHHRFTSRAEVIEFWLARPTRAQVEVRLKAPAS